MIIKKQSNSIVIKLAPQNFLRHHQNNFFQISSAARMLLLADGRRM
jgi:hypothetical protein